MLGSAAVLWQFKPNHAQATENRERQLGGFAPSIIDAEQPRDRCAPVGKRRRSPRMRQLRKTRGESFAQLLIRSFLVVTSDRFAGRPVAREKPAILNISVMDALNEHPSLAA
jgi:hypothetical protein